MSTTVMRTDDGRRHMAKMKCPVCGKRVIDFPDVALRRDSTLCEFSKAAGALIAAGDLSDGFAMLDTAFAYYERWTAFPDGASLLLGCGDAFGGATITKFGKQDSTSICFPDGKKVWSTYI